jgi:hypothetical protein
MVKVVCRVPARRSSSISPSSKARSRIAGSQEASACHLEILEGTKDDDDLVTTILRAIDQAESCGSGATVKLLKMALLNEGVRLAAILPQDEATLAAGEESSSAAYLNLVAQNGNRL